MRKECVEVKVMIKNPIFKGFNPAPCICRKGDDCYVAVSSFEWFPGIPIYHSKDLKNWELYTHVLTDDVEVDLKKLPSAKGIWAPCLTYCEEEDLFYVVYGVMNSMNARYFDVDNYLITAKDIKGPWSKPVYLHSAGFDASIFHDDDGRKWIVSLEWETREMLDTRISVDDVPIYLRLCIDGKTFWFEWSYNGENYTKIGGMFDTTKFSDEYCKYGEFTGTFVGMTCADRVLHKHYADFDFFEYKAKDKEEG